MRHHHFKEFHSIFTANRIESSANHCICGQTCQNEIRFKIWHTLLFLTGIYRFETQFLTNYNSCIKGSIHLVDSNFM